MGSGPWAAGAVSLLCPPLLPPRGGGALKGGSRAGVTIACPRATIAETRTVGHTPHVPSRQPEPVRAAAALRDPSGHSPAHTQDQRDRRWAGRPACLGRALSPQKRGANTLCWAVAAGGDSLSTSRHLPPLFSRRGDTPLPGVRPRQDLGARTRILVSQNPGVRVPCAAPSEPVTTAPPGLAGEPAPRSGVRPVAGNPRGLPVRAWAAVRLLHGDLFCKTITLSSSFQYSVW